MNFGKKGKEKLRNKNMDKGLNVHKHENEFIDNFFTIGNRFRLWKQDIFDQQTGFRVSHVANSFLRDLIVQNWITRPKTSTI